MPGSNVTKVQSPIKKQRLSQTKKAKNTLSEKEIFTFARKAVTALLLQRFATLRTDAKTPDFLPKTIQLLYRSVYGMDEMDADNLKKLTSNMKLVAKMLKIDVRSSLHAILVDFEDWFFGENYTSKIDSIYRFDSNEDQWPHGFFTEVLLKFNDTNDTRPCMILGKHFKTKKYGPNTEYFSWWHDTAERHRDAINNFMQVTAPASPPSAPASAPPEPEPVPEIIVFDTCDYAPSDTETDVDSIEHYFDLPLPAYDPSAEA